MNHNKKRLYLLVSAILAGGIIYAAPATSTVTNLQELIDAGGVIKTSDTTALRISDTKLFKYDGVVDITHTLQNYLNYGIESLIVKNSDANFKQLIYTVDDNGTSTDEAIDGIYVETGTLKDNSFNGSRITIGENSTVNITGNAGEWVIGLQVLGATELYNAGIGSIFEANVGDNSTFSIKNLGKGKAQGIQAHNTGATINLGENSRIHTSTNKGDSEALGSSYGGTVIAKKGLNLLAESTAGNAYAIYAWHPNNIQDMHHSKVILNGGTMQARSDDPSKSAYSLYVWNGGNIIGKSGKYTLNGRIAAFSGEKGDAYIDMTFDPGSTITGNSYYSDGSEINFDLKGTTWNITEYSNINNLTFSDDDSVINFVGNEYTTLEIENLTGNGGLFNLRSSIAEDDGDYLYIINGSGSHKLGVKDSGVEITKPDEIEFPLVTDESGNTHFALTKVDGTNINAIDGGTYLFYLHNRDENNKKVWYLSAEKQIDPDPTDPNPIDPTPPILETTPSTDAVISLASAPQLIMANEMNNLRFRKGSVKANAESAGVWGRVIGDSTKIKEGPAHFDLEQMGLEIGADTVLTLDSGSLLLGGMANYSWSDVKHHRGGKSKVDSYSLGLYATYFFDNGFYLDGVLKYNHFDNELRARSTQGDIVSSDYSQHGYGLSLEAGYDWDLGNNLWIEPYGKLSYISVNSKDIKLSNGMEAHISSHDSLTSELGFSFGKDFNLENSTIFSPYVKFAWNHEFIDDNKVRINNRHNFVNDFSGDHIKAGVGFNAKIQDDLSLFGEVNYRSGSYIDDSVQANFGIRYNF
ncbi:autotransporter outer membrane beta-barrel domain-containing protein [Ignatzschineria sp. RMDPL8A]|uniref:autotransporter outer membrane beta-barrel domain-containing protein n=1 Tax=Ignatzschineria sp. RMDPL8A TaxID=2999236 RepID=UPI002446632F|nr:autotransporter outer membrane beta-barrel domain-containing protein [Ignatzschineria sp. RMDPL8A]MDG9730113.1 autotransporter outer membrane beta-barrel domain-containing protein [Ignatzschineria sp. RMDPL8A]